MKKISLLTNLLKWLFAAIGAIVLYYVGYNVWQFFKPSNYSGPDGKKSSFEKAVPNIAEARDLALKSGTTSPGVQLYTSIVGPLSAWYVRTFK